MELSPGPRTPPARLTILAAAFVAAACALFATVGADAEWLAALGRDIARSWSIPSGVPFAAASSAGWHNVPVLGELIFHWLEAGLGTRGLLFAQLAAVVVCFWLVSVDMGRARVADQPAALVMMLVAFAATPALLIVRSQLFSLALFPVLLLLLREQARRPSRRVWLVVPLVALWTNLHGGVLLGVAVAGAYLIFARARREPLVAAGVLGGMIAALFVTPALFETANYYRGVVGSVAATDGDGMWRPLSLHAPFDVLFLVVAVPLVLLALRSKPALWEAVVIVGLAVVAVRASRNEVWLALFVAVPAARALTGRRAWGPVQRRQECRALRPRLPARFGVARSRRSGSAERPARARARRSPAGARGPRRPWRSGSPRAGRPCSRSRCRRRGRGSRSR